MSTMTTPPTHETTPNPASARTARRMAKLRRKVLYWWNTMPAETRRTHYLAAQITSAIGTPTTVLGPALRALGWRREQVRLQGRQVVVWIAPGAPSIKRAIGRPPQHHNPLQESTHDHTAPGHRNAAATAPDL